MPRRSCEPLILLLGAYLAVAVAGIAPYDRFTWLLEVFPIFIVTPILLVTWRRFPLSTLLYRLIFLHALILTLGAHYTYARVPLGFWMQDAFGLARNHYDRIGHLAQGFVPAIAVREVLLRTSPLRPGKWLAVITVCMCVAFSAGYEFGEWWASAATGEAADAFLGSQGDVWDTQWDMLMCTIGAVAALTLLSRVHDRILSRRG